LAGFCVVGATGPATTGAGALTLEAVALMADEGRELVVHVLLAFVAYVIARFEEVDLGATTGGSIEESSSSSPQ